MGAALKNYIDIIKILLHHGADRFIVDEYGRTALGWARLNNYEEAMRLLKNY